MKKKMDNLEKDVISAFRCGMSYGNYKAIHPITKTGEESEPRYSKCKECGKLFYKSRKSKVFCSDYCRDRYGYRKRCRIKEEAVKNGK